MIVYLQTSYPNHQPFIAIPVRSWDVVETTRFVHLICSGSVVSIHTDLFFCFLLIRKAHFRGKLIGSEEEAQTEKMEPVNF